MWVGTHYNADISRHNLIGCEDCTPQDNILTDWDNKYKTASNLFQLTVSVRINATDWNQEYTMFYNAKKIATNLIVSMFITIPLFSYIIAQYMYCIV